MNKNEVPIVWIDDFALKKREKYGTIMVDVRTHAIIDMLESREQADVVKWLKSYPNIQVVARDGSITYHNSITEAHPKAIQISDRFHLFKNLTDYAIEYLKKHLKKMVKIVIDCACKISPIVSGISKADENRKLTFYKYLDENFNPAHASYGVKRPRILSAFYKDIDMLLNQGVMASKIEEIIREKEFKGSSSTILHYASEWKKRFKENIKENEVEEGKEIITIKRNDIFKTLFRPVSDIKSLEEDKF